MKKCLYCGELVDTSCDDYQKVGKKIVCVFCYEENIDELNPFDDEGYDDPEEED